MSKKLLTLLGNLSKQNWVNEIVDYCDKYNILIEYLEDTLYMPKVVPMIRGMAFEFSAMLVLKRVLSDKKWSVEKVPMNAQLGLSDVDILVTHKKSNKKISIECKLASKESFKLSPDKRTMLRIKCMRSRTLGSAMIKQLAPKRRISEEMLAVHNDQYLPGDFDVLITSIGNAFYRTNRQLNIFEWKPSRIELKFLNRLFPNKKLEELKNLAFGKMYICSSKQLSISRKNKVACTRKKCNNKRSCGFIPNYPIISFQEKSLKPNWPWVEINKADGVLKNLIKQK